MLIAHCALHVISSKENYAVAENIYIPYGRSLGIPRVRGVAKANVVKGKFGAKLEFLEG